MVVIVGKDEKSWHRCSFQETSVCLNLSCFFSPSILHVSGQAVHESPYRVFEYVAVMHSSCKGETPPLKKNNLTIHRRPWDACIQTQEDLPLESPGRGKKACSGLSDITDYISILSPAQTSEPIRNFHTFSTPAPPRTTEGNFLRERDFVMGKLRPEQNSGTKR